MKKGKSLLMFGLSIMLASFVITGCGRRDDGIVEEGVTEEDDGEMVNEAPVDTDTNGMGSTGGPDGSGLVEETPDGDMTITDGTDGESVMDDVENAGEDLVDGVENAGEELVDGTENAVDDAAGNPQ